MWTPGSSTPRRLKRSVYVPPICLLNSTESVQVLNEPVASSVHNTTDGSPRRKVGFLIGLDVRQRFGKNRVLLGRVLKGRDVCATPETGHVPQRASLPVDRRQTNPPTAGDFER